MVALAGSLLLLLAACEEEDEEPPTPAQGSGVFVGLLQLLPDRPEVRAQVEMGDVQRAREALGVDVPPAEVDGKFNEQGFIEYVQALTPPGNARNSLAVDLRFLLGNAASRYLFVLGKVTYQSMGITLFDVDQWVTGGTAGSLGRGEVSREFHAVRGDFDPDAIESRLKECTACPAANVEDRRGWRIHGWGADFEANESLRIKPPMFDQFGRGGRIAMSDGVLMRALSTPDIHAMVDAAEGTGSLADNDDFRLAAEGLQRLDAWNAWLTERTLGPWNNAIGVPLRPYAVMAYGDGYQDGKRYLAIALVHRAAEDAAENARRLPERIAPAQQMFVEQEQQLFAEQPAIQPRPTVACDKGISDIDVEADGRLLLATLRFDEFEPRCWFGTFFLGLLAHEPTAGPGSPEATATVQSSPMPAPSSRAELATPSPGPAFVSRTDYGDRWPLTVDGGVVKCIHGAIIFTADRDETYAVNDTAKARRAETGWQDIDEIWAANPEPNADPKMDLSPLLDAGMAYC